MPACLFDVFADPGEHNDLVNTMPAKVAQMQSKLAELAKTAYGNPSDMSQKAACQQQVNDNSNHMRCMILACRSVVQRRPKTEALQPWSRSHAFLHGGGLR